MSSAPHRLRSRPLGRHAASARAGEAVWRILFGAAGAFCLIALAVVCLLPFRDQLDTGTVALILLVPPVVAASGGLWLGVGAAAASAGAFNFFFTRPYYTLRVDDNQSIAALVIYLCMALVLAVLASRLREARSLANRRARNASLLGGLAVEMIRQSKLEPPLRSALRDLVEALELRGAHLQVTNALGERVDIDSGDAELARALVPNSTSQSVVLREREGLALVPVATGDAAYGYLSVDPGPQHELGADAHRLLDSFAGVVALAAARSDIEEQAVRRRTLEESDRLRRALLHSISHDLRTPLTAIRTIAAALRGADVDEAQRDSMLGDVEHEAGRLARLVSNLLEVSRVESGALRPVRVPVPVEELCRAALDDARFALDKHAVELEIDPHLPPVDVDETMIRQVLVNLLENAAIHDAGPIKLRALRAGRRLELRVIDHGPGVPEAERQRIFEAFHRLRSHGGIRERGTGLGLAIARGFVEAHHGTIRVETTIGGGATFIVSLPFG
ncbi:MAG: two-component system, OmpR family, sensor histidine kinase KdpD [Gaiellales bacterium]|jgi:two-component system sensor histidine kinase KdpD|nr:two-component system, OmpR family, sensor histidine kinase KdpD [Gaiellales bacterium]